MEFHEFRLHLCRDWFRLLRNPSERSRKPPMPRTNIRKDLENVGKDLNEWYVVVTGPDKESVRASMDNIRRGKRLPNGVWEREVRPSGGDLFYGYVRRVEEASECIFMAGKRGPKARSDFDPTSPFGMAVEMTKIDFHQLLPTLQGLGIKRKEAIQAVRAALNDLETAK